MGDAHQDSMRAQDVVYSVSSKYAKLSNAIYVMNEAITLLPRESGKAYGWWPGLAPRC